jgi:putative transposase
MKSFDVSERRACSALCVSRTSKRYESRRPDCAALKQRLGELALSRPRYGYVRLHVLLQREGWLVNRKKVYRLYHELGLMVRTKRRRKHASHLRVAPSPTQHRNERWAMDFVSDSTADGRSFRVLTVIDTHTRECLALDVERSMGASHVTAALDRAIATRGKPRMITCDNGTEFTSNHFDAWAYKRGIAIDFIQPGRPVENGFIESFNGKLRDECLNTSWLGDLQEARTGIQAWGLDYNEVRPHSRLGQVPPATYVAGGSC